MTLYHFTTLIYLESIEREGITRGEIPITPEELENGVWLSSNKSGGSTGCQGGARRGGDGYIPDKTAARLTVEIPDEDELLKRWPVWAKERRVATSWYKKLDRAGNGGSLTWYVYLGKIPPEWIVKVERLRPATLDESILIKQYREGSIEVRSAQTILR
jgi:hypothetical protein